MSLSAQKNNKTKKVLLSKYLYSSPFAKNGLAFVCKDFGSSCGCIDTSGNVIIPFIYSMNYSAFYHNVSFFNSAGRILLAKKLELNVYSYGVIDEHENIILPFNYSIDESYHPLNQFHILIDRSANKYGLIDSLGKVRIPFEYDLLQEFGEELFHKKLKNKPRNLLLVTKNKELGLFTKTGKEILPINFTTITFSREGYFIGLRENSMSFFDENGKLIKEFASEIPLNTFSHKSFYTKYKLDNSNSRFKHTFKQTPVIEFPLIIKKALKFGVINGSLDSLVPYKYDSISMASYLLFPEKSQLFAFKAGERWGFIDSANQSIEGAVFDSLLPKGIVRKNKLFGWVNNNGELKIPTKHDALTPIFNTPIYDSYSFDNLYFISSKKNQAALLSPDNKVIIPYGLLHSIKDIHIHKAKKFIIGTQNNKYGVLNFDGSVAVPFEYDLITLDLDVFRSENYKRYVFLKENDSFEIDWKAVKITPH